MNQPASPDLAAIGTALGDESRATIMLALLDARAWTAGELATHAAVARSTMTSHLDHLLRVGLIEEVRQGRHRYVRIAGPRVAEAVESLSTLSPGVRPATKSLRGQRADAELRAGRTCYRHFAGALGIRLAQHWRRTGVITEDWQLSEFGRAWCDRRGISVEPDRRALLRPCLDWTERLEHAAGAMPDAFAEVAFARGWAERGSHPRSARLTAAGETMLGADSASA